MNRNLLTLAPQDRRREARQPASGTVRLHVEDPLPRELEMQLMDVSASGFRAAHRGVALPCGQSVDFRHPHGAGTARVAWNLVLSDHVETGFMVLATKSPRV